MKNENRKTKEKKRKNRNDKTTLFESVTECVMLKTPVLALAEWTELQAHRKAAYCQQPFLCFAFLSPSLPLLAVCVSKVIPYERGKKG